jgi:hypothetical protein
LCAFISHWNVSLYRERLFSFLVPIAAPIKHAPSVWPPLLPYACTAQECPDGFSWNLVLENFKQNCRAIYIYI